MERLTALEERVDPTLEAMGFEVVRVALMGSEGRMVLQVMADRRDGKPLSVADCEQISRTLSAIFDVEDPIPGAYDLEVSSAGIDRPLTRLKDFVAHTGFEAKVEVRTPVDGRKRFRGPLKGVTEDGKFLISNGEVVATIALANVVTAKLVMTGALLKAAAAAQNVN